MPEDAHDWVRAERWVASASDQPSRRARIFPEWQGPLVVWDEIHQGAFCLSLSLDQVLGAFMVKRSENELGHPKEHHRVMER